MGGGEERERDGIRRKNEREEREGGGKREWRARGVRREEIRKERERRRK